MPVETAAAIELQEACVNDLARLYRAKEIVADLAASIYKMTDLAERKLIKRPHDRSLAYEALTQARREVVDTVCELQFLCRYATPEAAAKGDLAACAAELAGIMHAVFTATVLWNQNGHVKT